ncbi:MAG TPA: flagellar basal body-associated FliL family protein [Stellaceae bacterium]|nr:flagellar basal body-associated FliL family protein [Stellaceae bacterium]
MTDIDEAAALDLGEPEGGSSWLKWVLIAVVALALLGGGGGAAWYFFMGGRDHAQPKKEVEAPLPYFLDLKPFVVSMPSGTGNSHFVQLGMSMQLPRAAAGDMVTAVLPEIQDATRQTLLLYKTEDLQNPEGVNKVRKALIERLNGVVARVLGPDRIAKMTDGANGVFVQNILFSTLIVE